MEWAIHILASEKLPSKEQDLNVNLNLIKQMCNGCLCTGTTNKMQ